MQEKRLVSSLWVHCGGLGPLIAAYDEFSKGTGLEQRFVLESHFSIESGWSWGLGFGFPQILGKCFSGSPSPYKHTYLFLLSLYMNKYIMYS